MRNELMMLFGLTIPYKYNYSVTVMIVMATTLPASQRSTASAQSFPLDFKPVLMKHVALFVMAANFLCTLTACPGLSVLLDFLAHSPRGSQMRQLPPCAAPLRLSAELATTVNELIHDKNSRLIIKLWILQKSMIFTISATVVT